jgi:hypothetical protein
MKHCLFISYPFAARHIGLVFYQVDQHMQLGPWELHSYVLTNKKGAMPMGVAFKQIE